LAIRLPGWCERPAIAVNGVPARFERRDGYAVIDRAWRKGDRVTLTLPMTLRAEAMPDDPDMIAFLHGPVVLAADLGPAAQPFDQLPPALVSADPLARARAVDAAAHRFAVPDARPAPLSLAPFFAQYDRRTAVYFPRFTADRWAREEATFVAAQREKAALEARTIDQINLGEMQPERDHHYMSNHSDLFSFAGRSARQLPWGDGNWLEFDMAMRDGQIVLRAVLGRGSRQAVRHFGRWDAGREGTPRDQARKAVRWHGLSTADRADARQAIGAGAARDAREGCIHLRSTDADGENPITPVLPRRREPRVSNAGLCGPRLPPS